MKQWQLFLILSAIYVSHVIPDVGNLVLSGICLVTAVVYGVIGE